MALSGVLERESTYIRSILRTLWLMRPIDSNSPYTITDIVSGIAAGKPNNVALLYLDQVVTYKKLDESANGYANWAHSVGIKKGDPVVLLMENRPEFIMAWLGLLKIGAIVALINTHLRAAPLAHSIGIAAARHAIIGSEMAGAFTEAVALLENHPRAWITGPDHTGGEDLDAALAAASTAPPDPSLRAGLKQKDVAFFIYTSGTTGLPKAANFTHLRMLYMMMGFVGALNVKESDRIYDVLPLYHSSGGVCAVGMALLTGGSLVIRKKFSAAEFWDDVHKYRPTIFQYIGELCRYLLNAPSHPHESDHGIRAITGNGLRPEIWPLFQQRFAIPKIVEFYGATEGNVAMLNYDGTVGAVGRIPDYTRWYFTTRIIRFDVEKEEAIRGADGFCTECKDNEVGECIGKIAATKGKAYDGYTKASDTGKKILRDVFEKGDAWFRTGDLMKRDAHGYFYFVDRVGDTFRWKGENVATGEVAEALGIVPGIRQANVYGVAVPGHDGRAGMAAIVTGANFDRTKLPELLARQLPSYARPVFLRLQPDLDVTGTFKLRKVDLVKEGFNPRAISDPLYWFDPAQQAYIPLSPDAYDGILAGHVKL
jgi:fatty-acyl-CoA synthase